MKERKKENREGVGGIFYVGFGMKRRDNKSCLCVDILGRVKRDLKERSM